MGTDAEIVRQAPMNDTAILEAGPEVKDYANFWKSVKIRFYNPSNGMSKEAYINYPYQHFDLNVLLYLFVLQ